MRIVPPSQIGSAPHVMRRAGEAVAGGVGAGPKTAAATGASLVATSPPLRSAPPSSHWSRPDPNFIAHLIATAEQSPQTRTLRRAEIADVEAAYRAVANHNAAAPDLRVRRTA